MLLALHYGAFAVSLGGIEAHVTPLLLEHVLFCYNNFYKLYLIFFVKFFFLVMAYMEMFGNCSHTLNAHPPINPEAPPDMFRHSIHTYNLTRYFL